MLSADTSHSDVDIESDRLATISKAVGGWSFSAHEFSDDELLQGALIILEHALQMPELKHWRMSKGIVSLTRKENGETNLTR